MPSVTTVVVLVLALCAFGSTKNVPSIPADKDFLLKQKFVLEIFQHIYQDDVFVTKYDASYRQYKPWEHMDDYSHVELIEPFIDLWLHKPMHDDEIFNIISNRHVEYAAGLTRLFYYAKDWDIYTRAAFWARTHVNKQLFIYCLTVASLLRSDMEGIVLPAIYEIHPWYFFDVETLEAANQIKMHGFHKIKKVDNIYNIVIKSNYTNVYGDLNANHKLAYYLEDVGLNAFYYNINIDYPYWSQGIGEPTLNSDRRGEFYLFAYQQLVARFYLERLANDLGPVEFFNPDEFLEAGYYNGLRYYSGMSFPNRENNHRLNVNNNHEEIEVLRMRIAEYISKNKLEYLEAVNQLGNIIQGNADSINQKYYGSIDHAYRRMLSSGRPYGKYQEDLPTTFMHYETSLRDPLFLQMMKNIVSLYYDFTATFPEYTKKDLMFDGVTLDAVHMPESLTTYFDYFDSDISNAVNVEVPTATDDELVNFGRNSHYKGNSYVIKARQRRLNHKPFEFSLDVSSDKAQKAVLKFFVGRRDEKDEKGRYIELEQNYMNFFKLDHFVIDLVAGKNTIKLNSQDFTWYVDDRTTYLELYQKVKNATNTDYKFLLNQMEAHCGIPNRLMFPKGKKGGMAVQFFFIVYKYYKTDIKQFTGFNPIVNCGVGHGSRFVDVSGFGFPFNRPVKHGYYFNVDNVKFHEIKIYHKDNISKMPKN